MYDLYTSYGKIDDIELEKNKVTIMMVYTPKLTMAIITNQFGEVQNFAQDGKQYITDAMIISKGITIWNNTVVFPNDTKEWNRKLENSKTWAKFKTHFFHAHK